MHEDISYNLRKQKEIESRIDRLSLLPPEQTGPTTQSDPEQNAYKQRYIISDFSKFPKNF